LILGWYLLIKLSLAFVGLPLFCYIVK
jgi:hypothetical protein